MLIIFLNINFFWGGACMYYLFLYIFKDLFLFIVYIMYVISLVLSFSLEQFDWPVHSSQWYTAW